MYEASTTIMVGQNRGLIQNPSEVSSLEQITETMAQAVVTRPIVEDVIQQLNLQIPPQDLAGSLRAMKVSNTQFIKVTYTDASPQKAQLIVNAVGEEFSETVAQLQGNAAAATADAYQQPGGGTGEVVVLPPTTPIITATVWEYAEVPGAPVRPDPKRDGLFALALGLMLGVGLAFLLEHLTTSDKWSSLDEVEPISGVPIIGVIPK
jgi:capsular polysaccharide biosynthesis protein